MRIVPVLLLLAFLLPAQELKHLSVPTTTSIRPLDVAALDVQRESQVWHLKGAVEIKTPVCLVVDPSNAQMCSGYVVLRADEAELHEDTGRIDARGKVTVTREP
jgi:lipopolysaccharide assembly outer membrane protein LptD (OstA)